jgi:6-phosphogluconolactonase
LSLEFLVVPDLVSIARISLSRLRGNRIAVSGGSTFAALFPLWREALSVRLAAGESFRFYPVDERLVAYEEPGCNWKVCTDALLTPLGLRDQISHHVTSVSGFENLLSHDLKPDFRFDTVFLGMGTDGHTASLFPGGDYLSDETSLVLETLSPKPPYPRLTLGLRCLWEAQTLIAIVTGKDKAEMVAKVKAGDRSLPLTRALAGHPKPLLILDEAAAAG